MVNMGYKNDTNILVELLVLFQVMEFFITTVKVCLIYTVYSKNYLT